MDSGLFIFFVFESIIIHDRWRYKVQIRYVYKTLMFCEWMNYGGISKIYIYTNI